MCGACLAWRRGCGVGENNKALCAVHGTDYNVCMEVGDGATGCGRAEFGSVGQRMGEVGKEQEVQCIHP